MFWPPRPSVGGGARISRRNVSFTCRRPITMRWISLVPAILPISSPPRRTRSPGEWLACPVRYRTLGYPRCPRKGLWPSRGASQRSQPPQCARGASSPKCDSRWRRLHPRTEAYPVTARTRSSAPSLRRLATLRSGCPAGRYIASPPLHRPPRSRGPRGQAEVGGVGGPRTWRAREAPPPR